VYTGVLQGKEFTMLLPVFLGQKYSYSYEPETGHYLLYDKQYKSRVYFQGDDDAVGLSRKIF
jgi:hypothetical protein